MNVSAATARIYLPPTTPRPSAASTAAVQPRAAAPIDADGDHDRDSAAGDRLDVRG